MEERTRKAMISEEQGFWARSHHYTPTHMIWEKKATGTMEYGRIEIEPFPGKERETASDWMLMEGIPLLVTLEREDGAKLQLKCLQDPERIVEAFGTALANQLNILSYDTHTLWLSATSPNPCLLLRWWTETELEVRLVPPWYGICELPVDSEEVASFVQKTGREKEPPFGSFDDFKTGVRYSNIWSYQPSDEKIIRLVAVPEGLQTIIESKNFLASLKKMWDLIIERWALVTLTGERLNKLKKEYEDRFSKMERTMESLEHHTKG